MEEDKKTLKKNDVDRETNLWGKWDAKYVWHPFTQMKQWLSGQQIIIEKARGPYLIDVEGKKYLDGVSSLWVTVHGHNHPHINRAILNQLEKLDHSTLLGLGNTPSIELARRLIEISPNGLQKVFYSDNGSTSVEVALKMAFQYWQQRKPDSIISHPEKKINFITLAEAYHGDTIGSVSLGGIELFHQLYHPLLFKTIQIPSPKNDPNAEKAFSIIKENHEKIAALVMEPLMQGAAGMLKAPKGYLKKISAVCKAHHILLILDEVATGFGRTGKMFACEHEEVSPDFLCLAKGLSGGVLPLAVTLTTNEIYEIFMGEVKDLKTFFHGHTYTGNPLACAAAIANLELFEDPNFWPVLNEKINHLKNVLENLSSHPNVGEIRQVGLMVGIELLKDKKTGRSFDYQEQMGAKVCYMCRKQGLILRPLGNVIVLMPPFCMTKGELSKMVDIVSTALKEVFK